MVNEIDELKKNDNFLVKNNENTSVLFGELWKDVINIGRFKEYITIKGWMECKENINRIKDTLKKYERVNIFLPSIRTPIGNVIVSYLKKKNREISLCNFPDGIGSLYIIDMNIKEVGKDIGKYLWAKVIGYDYTLYLKNDFLGMQYFDKVYSLLPSMIEGSSRKVIQIPLLNVHGKIEDKTCIVLGTFEDLFESSSFDKWRESLEEIAEYSKKYSGCTRFLYKPHHRDDNNFGYNIMKKYGFYLLNDKRSIEEILLKEVVPAVIISICSSALVHVKLMSGSNIKCIAYKPNVYIRRKGDFNVMKKVFFKVGVEVVE